MRQKVKKSVSLLPEGEEKIILEIFNFRKDILRDIANHGSKTFVSFITVFKKISSLPVFSPKVEYF